MRIKATRKKAREQKKNSDIEALGNIATAAYEKGCRAATGKRDIEMH